MSARTHAHLAVLDVKRPGDRAAGIRRGHRRSLTRRSRAGAREARALRLPHGRRLSHDVAKASAPPTTSVACKPTGSASDVDVARAPLEPSLRFAAASLREGFVAPSLKLAVFPEHRLLRRRRAERPGGAAPMALPAGPRGAGPCAPSPSFAPATSWCTRTTASRASLAFRRAPWLASPATTSTSNTRATTRCSSPPTSSPRSPATSAPGVRGVGLLCRSSAARAGRR